MSCLAVRTKRGNTGPGSESLECLLPGQNKGIETETEYRRDDEARVGKRKKSK